MKRRRLLTASVATAAVAAGAGLAWRRQHASPTDPLPPGVEPGAAEQFWAQRFERPGGGELVAASMKGRPLLLNFWATWCPPCVEEMPLLDRFEREQQARGWQVLGLAVDRLKPVQDFLAKRPMGFAIALSGAQGLDLTRRFGNSSGALPFSAAFAPSGRLVKTHLGPLTAADLDAWSRLAG
jgi:thiol-disulfide isomerase/thioredoxin